MGRDKKNKNSKILQTSFVDPHPEAESGWRGNPSRAEEETFSGRNFFCPFWIRSQKEERKGKERRERGNGEEEDLTGKSHQSLSSLSRFAELTGSHDPQMLVVNLGEARREMSIYKLNLAFSLLENLLIHNALR